MLQMKTCPRTVTYLPYGMPYSKLRAGLGTLTVLHLEGVVLGFTMGAAARDPALSQLL